MENKISPLSRILLVAAAVLLAASLYVPIWSIYLDAPQYPEGLRLQIWANDIAGDVDIINGLNHYIGMKTLHSKDFIEFTVLPYIIAGYALLFLAVVFIARRGWLYGVFIAFVLFGVVAMADFWKWEYDYGHNLDPNAAIKVPGMAYQPPLIGFKQLLNFGAYSIPDLGGWFFVGAGALLLVAVVYESKIKKRSRRTGVLLMLLCGSMAVSSCSPKGPEPVLLNRDACDFCKMSISDGRFAAEVISTRGRAYKFDDIGCMAGYLETVEKSTISHYYIGDFTKNNELTDATTAWYVKHESLRSPMRGNTAAFPTREAAEKLAQELGTKVMSWNEAINGEPSNGHNHHDGHAH